MLYGPSVNPVEAVLSWKTWDGNPDHLAGGGLHGGATPASWSFYFFTSIDSHWIIDSVMIFRSWPIPGKLTIVNYHGWSSLLHLFRLNRSFYFPVVHWLLGRFHFLQDHSLLDLFLNIIDGRDVIRASHTSRM